MVPGNRCLHGHQAQLRRPVLWQLVFIVGFDVVSSRWRGGPLLWELRRGNASAFLTGVEQVGLAEMQPISDVLTQAAGCADVAFFQLACPLRKYGAYFAHCLSYPVVDPRGTLLARLSKGDFDALNVSVRSLLEKVGHDCSWEAARLELSMHRAELQRNRTTLAAVHEHVLGALDGPKCRLARGGESYDDFLRNLFSSQGKPIFGLEDVMSECLSFEGQTVAAEVELARILTTKYSNDSWVAAARHAYDSLPQILRTGDDSLFAEVGHAAPWFANIQLMGERCADLAAAIREAFEKQGDKVPLFAVGLQYLIQTNSSPGLPSLLSQLGFMVERVNNISCAASDYRAPGTQELSLCFEPHGHAQPESCIAFRDKFDNLLGSDPLLGRTKFSNDCADCVAPNNTKSCTCRIKWRNTSRFRDLCTNTTVGDVQGAVYELDLTRNPGSTVDGASSSEKGVRGIFMNCYATSCDIPLLEETQTRMWYSTDPSVSFGQVTAREADEGDGDHEIHTEGSGPLVPKMTSRIWGKLLVALVITLFIAALLASFFFKPKHPKDNLGSVWKVRSATSSPREPFAPCVQDSFEEGQVGAASGPTSMAKMSARARSVEEANGGLMLQAMEMRHRLGVAGANAINTLTWSGLQSMHSSAMQSMQPHQMPTQLVGSSPQVGRGSPSHVMSPGPGAFGYGLLGTYLPESRYEALRTEDLDQQPGNSLNSSFLAPRPSVQPTVERRK
mmetsp:Transcript_12056/g.34461  ORF Transcript_12056/g.34461 Transcript_12056/m.34461 type:complete len:730 (+) Transcript_12056:31-2220(+)